MRMKKRFIATLDQVKISREGICASIEYHDPQVGATSLQIGPEVQSMTDAQILDCHNECLRAQQKMMDEYVHIAVEVPPGQSQIKYFELGHQWVPRGDVVRCVIDDAGPDEGPIIYIDDHDLTLREFGSLLRTYAGWGMRIVFVPENRTEEEPIIEVREPDK